MIFAHEWQKKYSTIGQASILKCNERYGMISVHTNDNCLRYVKQNEHDLCGILFLKYNNFNTVYIQCNAWL